jgi:hypothetical protein
MISISSKHVQLQYKITSLYGIKIHLQLMLEIKTFEWGLSPVN